MWTDTDHLRAEVLGEFAEAHASVPWGSAHIVARSAWADGGSMSIAYSPTGGVATRPCAHPGCEAIVGPVWRGRLPEHCDAHRYGIGRPPASPVLATGERVCQWPGCGAVLRRSGRAGNPGKFCLAHRTAANRRQCQRYYAMKRSVGA